MTAQAATANANVSGSQTSSARTATGGLRPPATGGGEETSGGVNPTLLLAVIVLGAGVAALALGRQLSPRRDD